jgi:REP element-mobilizing transposase RayT
MWGWYNIPMAIRKHPFVVGEFYHLYNRGVERRKLFIDRADYEHMMFLLYICNSQKSIKLRDLGKTFERGETIVDIGAYCLMPNHLHLLTREKQEEGISLYMRKVMTAYSMYFNKKYTRTGTLFEGVFKSTHCGDDRYLKYLYSYIHLNPAKIIDKNWRESKNKERAKLTEYVFNYKYSSLQEYLYKPHIINPKPFPTYFVKPKDHKKELLEWLSTPTQDSPV